MKAEIGKRYRHYKRGDEYTVLHLARREEDGVECVVYRAEYETTYGTETLWIRERTSFEEEILVNGDFVHRFARID